MVDFGLLNTVRGKKGQKKSKSPRKFDFSSKKLPTLANFYPERNSRVYGFIRYRRVQHQNRIFLSKITFPYGTEVMGHYTG